MPLFWLSLCFTIGIGCSPVLQLTPLLRIVLLSCTAILFYIEYKICGRQAHPLLSRRLFRVGFSLLAAAFLIGEWTFQSHVESWYRNDALSMPGQEKVTATGKIISYPEQSSSSLSAVLEVEEIRTDQGVYQGNFQIQIWLPAGFHLSYGDRIEAAGEIIPAQNSGQMPRQSHLTVSEISGKMFYPRVELISQEQRGFQYQVYRLRDASHRLIYEQMPFPESALVSGVLLGIDWNIPDFLQDAYRRSGTIHIVAISGFNIALISGLVSRLFRRIFPVYWDSFFAILAIFVYTILVGAEPPVVRAAIMGAAAIPAYYIGRRIIGINHLAITASAMLLFSPCLLWDVSFRLSFLATLGLMTLADPLASFLEKTAEKKFTEHTLQLMNPAIILVASTLAAQLAVSPVLFELDPSIQLYSLPANLIILPLQPLIMGFGGIGVITGLAVPAAGNIFGQITWLLAALSNRIAVYFALLPIAELPIPKNLHRISWVIVAILIAAATARQLSGYSRPVRAQDQDGI